MTKRFSLLLVSLVAVAAPFGGVGFAADQGAAPMAPPMASMNKMAPMNSMAARTPSPKGAKVYFIDLASGAHVTSPFVVRFGLTGMGIAPAGVTKPNTGHHHLIVDAPLPALDGPIPKDKNHIHFGLGQTETELALPPGTHTLQLVLADANHMPHNPPVYSPAITITVDKP
jgi:hypothetical protein